MKRKEKLSLWTITSKTSPSFYILSRQCFVLWPKAWMQWSALTQRLMGHDDHEIMRPSPKPPWLSETLRQYHFSWSQVNNYSAANPDVTTLNTFMQEGQNKNSQGLMICSPYTFRQMRENKEGWRTPWLLFLLSNTTYTVESTTCDFKCNFEKKGVYWCLSKLKMHF